MSSIEVNSASGHDLWFMCIHDVDELEDDALPIALDWHEADGAWVNLALSTNLSIDSLIQDGLGDVIAILSEPECALFRSINNFLFDQVINLEFLGQLYTFVHAILHNRLVQAVETLDTNFSVAEPIVLHERKQLLHRGEEALVCARLLPVAECRSKVIGELEPDQMIQLRDSAFLLGVEAQL